MKIDKTSVMCTPNYYDDVLHNTPHNRTLGSPFSLLFLWMEGRVRKKATATICSWLPSRIWIRCWRPILLCFFTSSRLWRGDYRRRMGLFGWYVTSCRHCGIGTRLLVCIPMAAAADAAIVNGIIHQLDRYYVVESPQWRGKRRWSWTGCVLLLFGFSIPSSSWSVPDASIVNTPFDDATDCRLRKKLYPGGPHQTHHPRWHDGILAFHLAAVDSDTAVAASITNMGDVGGFPLPAIEWVKRMAIDPIRLWYDVQYTNANSASGKIDLACAMIRDLRNSNRCHDYHTLRLENLSITIGVKEWLSFFSRMLLYFFLLSHAYDSWTRYMYMPSFDYVIVAIVRRADGCHSLTFFHIM